MSRPVILTGKEVCDRLGVCYRTVLRWRKRHGLPMFTIGQRLYAYEEEVMRWFEKHRYHLPDE